MKIECDFAVKKFNEFELLLSSLSDDAISNEYKKIESERYKFIKDLLSENNQNENCDKIHDYILSEDDGLIEKPKGYKISIVGSFYVPYIRCYKTVVFVVSPNYDKYYVSVNTINKVSCGELI